MPLDFFYHKFIPSKTPNTIRPNEYWTPKKQILLFEIFWIECRPRVRREFSYFYIKVVSMEINRCYVESVIKDWKVVVLLLNHKIGCSSKSLVIENACIDSILIFIHRFLWYDAIFLTVGLDWPDLPEYNSSYLHHFHNFYGKIYYQNNSILWLIKRNILISFL